MLSPNLRTRIRFSVWVALFATALGLALAAPVRWCPVAHADTLEPWQRELLREWLADHPGESAPNVDFGVPTAPQDVSVADGAWSPYTPPIRYHHAAVYDSKHDRMIIFGGFGLSGTSGGIFNDVWTLSLGSAPSWQSMATTGTPPPGRYSCSAVYDIVGDRIVIFGGETVSGAPSNDVWALDLKQAVPAWSRLLPAGTPPTKRTDQAAVYDALRNRMVVFGGLDSLGYNLNDTWVLDLGAAPAWTNMQLSNVPPPRRSAAMIYDPVRDQLIVHGGFGDSPDLNDVWVLGLNSALNWTPLFTSNPPPGRHNHTAVYDPVRDRMVIFGGGTASATFNDVWALPLNASFPSWTQLTPAGARPIARYGHASIYDPVRDRMIVCAGRDTTGIAALPAILRGDTWVFSFATVQWSPMPAVARSAPSMAWDSFRDQMVVFGGNDGAVDLNDVWTLSLSGGRWAPLLASGTPPSSRQHSAMAYDVVRDRLYVFGGIGGGACSNQLWQLARGGVPTWTLLTPAGTPPDPREGAGLWLDRTNDRLVLVGGHRTDPAGDVWYNDVWVLPLQTMTWQKLTPTGTPPAARTGHVLVYDSKRNRLLLQGGVNAAGTLLSDTWALSLGGTPAWSVLTASGTPPSLTRHTAIYDPVRDRLVLFGGWGGSPAFYRGDTKALTLAGAPTWATLSPTSTGVPRPRMDASGFYDPRRDRMVLFGGYGSYTSRLGTLDDTWFLTWGAPVAVDDSPRATLVLEAPAPNPARSATRIAFTLPVAGHARVTVHDVAGRTVRVLADRAFAAGRTVLAWDGRSGSGAPAEAGVYFVRLAAPGAVCTERIALTR